ncbi:hypothetical protein Hamer_G027483 [Homarus americanus]|uniref:Uncharacterized protein n=1 Tax=Homarus americanus TaxID=6706 RepID=A0A8J5MMS7_HOMAM|nr:hypothetical protein Hamer_G027483 [Homarus americanus]
MDCGICFKGAPNRNEWATQGPSQGSVERGMSLSKGFPSFLGVRFAPTPLKLRHTFSQPFSFTLRVTSIVLGVKQIVRVSVSLPTTISFDVDFSNLQTIFHKVNLLFAQFRRTTVVDLQTSVAAVGLHLLEAVGVGVTGGVSGAVRSGVKTGGKTLRTAQMTSERQHRRPSLRRPYTTLTTTSITTEDHHPRAIYTDGSLQDTGAAGCSYEAYSGMTCVAEAMHRLPDWTSTTDCELQGIFGDHQLLPGRGAEWVGDQRLSFWTRVDHFTPSSLSGSSEIKPALPHKGEDRCPPYTLYMDRIPYWLPQTRLCRQPRKIHLNTSYP